MINRVLIRIKVIQILYSFLLVEKQFNLESQPSSPTKEKRFAYSLYLSMLLLFTKLSERISKRGGERPLEETRFIKKLITDDKIKSLATRYQTEHFDFDSIVDDLAFLIKESSIYKKFLKREESEAGYGDETIWKELFDTVIMTNPSVNAIISKRENYTLRGVERMRQLMDESFTNFMVSQENIKDAIKTLRHSLEKARELYIRLLALPIELTHLREIELDERRHRYLTTEEDINPNLKFVENGFVKSLTEDTELEQLINKHKISWNAEEPLMMRRLLKAIVDSDIYKEYMEKSTPDFSEDCELWKKLFRQVIFTNEAFLESLEDKSVFWNDDLDIIGTFVIKTIKRYQEGNSDRPILDKFKDQEDARFGDELIRYVIKNKDTYRSYINEALNSKNWETERLAFMDVVIMETALAEILNFPKIPLSASINEYIEIAKSYSTSKSGSFVHGLLGGIVSHLKSEGKLLGKA